MFFVRLFGRSRLCEGSMVWLVGAVREPPLRVGCPGQD